MGNETGMGLYTVLVWDWYAGDVYHRKRITWNSVDCRGVAVFLSVVFLLREGEGVLLTVGDKESSHAMRGSLLTADLTAGDKGSSHCVGPSLPQALQQ